MAEIISYKNALFRAMDSGLAGNPDVVIMGQGVNDHKGIFGTTTDLDKKYGSSRVFDIPLSEESNTGIAIGAALNGLYPIQTHVRNDFILLAMSQLINSAAKYKYMYGGAFEVPFLIRMVIGRSWGQGAQHSQSLQSLFAHIPGLVVIMPSSADAVLSSYHYAISHYKGPVLSLEHRLLYDIPFHTAFNAQKENDSPFTSLMVREGQDVTIVATSILVVEALRVSRYLQENWNINCEIIDLNCISHFDKEMIIKSVRKTKKLLVADTSWQAYGVAAEISRIICEHDPSMLEAPVISLGNQATPCPTSKKLENLFYPNDHQFAKNIIKLVRGNAEAEKLEMSVVDSYQNFKGPF